MNKRSILLLSLLGSLLFAGPANAAYVVGIGDQSAATFADPNWQSLKLKKVRYIVPYNAASVGYQAEQDNAYIAAAQATRQEVFVTFTAKRGCYSPNTGRYSTKSSCKPPSKKQFSTEIKKFMKLHPSIKVYGSWNEANSASQPTYKKPKLAADYYSATKAACKKCTVMAGDLLDTSNLRSYAKSMVRYTKGRAKLWGLHNYGDVNRFRSSGTTTMLKTVPGSVWLTETGGLYKFARSGFKASASRQSKATKYMFSLAAKYDSKRKGNRSRIVRLYPYQWRAASGDAFDAGLVDLKTGAPRSAYKTFKSKVAKVKK